MIMENPGHQRDQKESQMTRTVLRSPLPFVLFTRVRLRRVHAHAVVDKTGLAAVGVGALVFCFSEVVEN